MNVFSFCSALCHGMGDPALLCDGEGRISEINRPARHLLRGYPEVAEGADLAALLALLAPEHDLDPAVVHSTRGSQSQQTQVVVRAPGGAAAGYRLTIVPVPDGGEVGTMVLFSQPTSAPADTDPLLLLLDGDNHPAWLSNAAREHLGPEAEARDVPAGPTDVAIPGVAEDESRRLVHELAALREGLVPSVQFVTQEADGDRTVLWSCTTMAGPQAERVVAAVGTPLPWAGTPAAQASDGRLLPADDDRRRVSLRWPAAGCMLLQRSLAPGYPITRLSGDCEQVTGYSARDLAPGGRRPYADLVLPADREIVAEHLATAGAGRPLDVVYRLRTADGETRWVRERGWLTHDADGQPAAIEGVVTDLSHLTEAGEQVRATRGLFRSLFSVTPAGVIVEDVDGRIIDANDAACQILQLPRELILGQEARSSVWECVDSDEQPVAYEDLPSVRARARGESVRGITLGLRHPARPDRLWLLLNAEPLPVVGAPFGGRLRSIVSFTDVTAQREALTALGQSQGFAQRIVDTSPNLIYIHDVQGQRNVYANPETRRLLGYSPEELQELGPNLLDVIMDARDLAEIRRHREWLATQADGTHVEFEHRMRRADGEWRVYRAREVAFSRTPDGEVEHVVGTAEDVTDRKRAEEAIRRGNETAWALLNAHADMALLVDAQGTILAANDAVARAMGKQGGGEVVGTNVAADDEVGRGELQLGLLQEAVATGQPASLEVEKDGRYLTHRVYPIADDDGQVSRVAVFVQDVTGRKRAEDAARLAAVGQLAAGVAHDFNNLLAAMILAAEIATDLQTEEDSRRLADIVLRSSARGLEISRNLIAFASPQEPTRAPVSLLVPLKNALATAARHIQKAGVEVVQQYEPGSCRVLANAGQMEEVFLNIIINACHAMATGGTITIGASEQTRHGQQVAVVSLADTGTGLAPEHLPRIFEPFYTTKGRVGYSETPGTGLGLSVAHRVVTAHGGTIRAESQVGRGTCFTIELPLADESAEVPAEAAPAPPEPVRMRRGARVLVAEDEKDVAAALQRLLVRDGHDVVVASTVVQALVALQGEGFDLVITDLMVPGGSGREVIRRARAMDPPLPVLVVTGVPAEGLADEMKALGAAAYLAKPFGIQALRAAVAQLLGPPEE